MNRDELKNALKSMIYWRRKYRMTSYVIALELESAGELSTQAVARRLGIPARAAHNSLLKAKKDGLVMSRKENGVWWVLSELGREVLMQLEKEII